MPPNLFDYATKELSQDAVICWLMKCAEDDSDAELQALGRRFVRSLLNHEPGNRVLDREVRRVEIWQQERGIDVLARINGRHVLLIEDKKEAGPRGNQLERYRNVVLNGRTRLGQVAEVNLFPIYFKTGNQPRRTERQIEAESYRIFNRGDFISVLACYKGISDIVCDFRCWLASVEQQTQSFRTWRDGGERHWRGWQGLYRELEAMFLGVDHVWNGWHKVNNAAGGFWAFFWGRRGMLQSRPVYIQLEEEGLCVKVEAGHNAINRQQLWNFWNDQMTNGIHGLATPRMHPGETMTVAVHQDGWLRYGAGRFLDIHATVAFLRQFGGQVQNIVHNAVVPHQLVVPFHPVVVP